MGRRLIFDVESNGLLNKRPFHLHCLVMRDIDTDETFRFRRVVEPSPVVYAPNVDDGAEPEVLYEAVEPQDNIAEGIAMLEEADEIIGHNIIHFDLKAIRLVFPDFAPKGIVTDTLVLSRMIVPDTKTGDAVLSERGKLPGALIGSHSLDAWGYRLGKSKGDYAKVMLAKGLDPWAAWNPFMEDYCENDIDVNEVLYFAITAEMPPDRAVALEHQIHEIVCTMQDNGYFFDEAQAEKLAIELSKNRDALVSSVKEKFGSWYKPAKKKIIKPQWDDPLGINAAKQYEKPDTAWGEDYSRAVWGRMVFPKVTYRKHKTLGDRTEGCPYVPIERVDFNPGSRPQIIDRFTTVYDWEPQEFTEAGSPQVDDAVLNKLAKRIPEAADLSEISFYNKLIGQLATGRASWMNAFNKETFRIHPYTNTGGTVSNRCSHKRPNIGQVPSIKDAKIDVHGDVWDGDDKLDITPDGYLLVKPAKIDENGKEKAGKVLLKGRLGDYGFECRSLFYTPERWEDRDWDQVGVDLSGIEFRMLAEICYEFDKGELIQVVLSGDIHQINMDSTGITNRGVVKRVLYGLLYGAGDWKLGHTIDPYATDAAKKSLGATVRAKLMRGLPALAKAIEKAKSEAERGYLIALDGRRLPARSPHSALNLRLQGNAASIAKKWVCLTEDLAFDRGWDHGWKGNFAMLAFVHDELQSAVNRNISHDYAQLCVRAAGLAGEFFGMHVPIDAEAKIGADWAECH